MTIVQQSVRNTLYLYHAPAYAEFDSRLFNADYLQSHGLVNRTAKGRGTTYFFEHNSGMLVLRHYWRGGLIGRLVADAYLWLGLSKARAFNELKLLAHLQQVGLPAPRPVAARIVRSGLVCRSDIITTCIANSRTLIELLASPVEPAVWEQVAALIARFHRAGVYHADLNAANVLVDDQGVCYIIDFDRGRLMPNLDASWRQANIDRFKRSLLKEQGRQASFCFSDEDWSTFQRSYQAAWA